jgi:hypothetical protein
VTKIAGIRLLVLITVLGFTIARSAAPAQPKPDPKGELAQAADSALRGGIHEDLPPHISTLLGLTSEEKCPVMQSIVRSKDHIQGIDVSVDNHSDIVIFVVDETTQGQRYYLTSPAGELRKMLSIKQGVGYLVRPSSTDKDVFLKEKHFWMDPAASHPQPK